MRSFDDLWGNTLRLAIRAERQANYDLMQKSRDSYLSEGSDIVQKYLS
jgi:hypothetical protein